MSEPAPGVPPERLLRRIELEEAATPTDVFVRIAGDELVVRIVGEVSSETSRALREAVEPCLAGMAVASFDLGETSFIDSLGIAWLVHVQAQVAAQGGRFQVTDAGRLVRRVLEAVALDARFGLPPSD